MNRQFKALLSSSAATARPCAAGRSVHHALLLLEAQVVRDHGDELAVRGLALDVRHRVAEELLQHLDIAPVPGHLDGVTDFQG